MHRPRPLTAKGDTHSKSWCMVMVDEHELEINRLLVQDDDSKNVGSVSAVIRRRHFIPLKRTMADRQINKYGDTQQQLIPSSRGVVLSGSVFVAVDPFPLPLLEYHGSTSEGVSFFYTCSSSSCVQNKNPVGAIIPLLSYSQQSRSLNCFSRSSSTCPLIYHGHECNVEFESAIANFSKNRHCEFIVQLQKDNYLYCFRPPRTQLDLSLVGERYLDKIKRASNSSAGE